MYRLVQRAVVTRRQQASAFSCLVNRGELLWGIDPRANCLRLHPAPAGKRIDLAVAIDGNETASVAAREYETVLSQGVCECLLTV